MFILWYNVSTEREKKLGEVKAVGKREDSTWTWSHCVLIVSLTTLSGGGAGVEHRVFMLMVFQRVHIYEVPC